MASVVSFIRGQRIVQWLGLMWRCSEGDINKEALKWKPTGIRLRERPRKIWLDLVEGGLEDNGS